VGSGSHLWLPRERAYHQLIRKLDSYWARGSTGGVQRSRWDWCGGSGGAFEDDGVAECFELADVVAPAAVGVDAGGVEA
jgi:hypothetical protein